MHPPDGSFGAGGVVNVDVSGRLYGTARMLITSDGGVWAVADGDSAFAVRTGSDGQTLEVSALTGAWYPDPENPFDLRGLIAGGDGMLTAVLAGYRLCGLPTCAFQSHGLTFVHFFAGQVELAR